MLAPYLQTSCCPTLLLCPRFCIHFSWWCSASLHRIGRNASGEKSALLCDPVRGHNEVQCCISAQGVLLAAQPGGRKHRPLPSSGCRCVYVNTARGGGRSCPGPARPAGVLASLRTPRPTRGRGQLQPVSRWKWLHPSPALRVARCTWAGSRNGRPSVGVLWVSSNCAADSFCATMRASLLQAEQLDAQLGMTPLAALAKGHTTA